MKLPTWCYICGVLAFLSACSEQVDGSADRNPAGDTDSESDIELEIKNSSRGSELDTAVKELEGIQRTRAKLKHDARNVSNDVSDIDNRIVDLQSQLHAQYVRDLLNAVYENDRAAQTAAFKKIAKFAEDGYPPSQLWLGSLLYVGIGNGKNAKESRRWMDIAASNGNGEAQMNLCIRASDQNVEAKDAYRWCKISHDRPISYRNLPWSSNYAAKQIGVSAAIAIVKPTISEVNKAQIDREVLEWLKKDASMSSANHPMDFFANITCMERRCADAWIASAHSTSQNPD